MLDLKTFKSALEQLEEERKIPKEKILEAIEQAMAAAYKKDYGKKGQIIRAKFDLETGQTDFFQVKIVVDESIAILDTPPSPSPKEREEFKPHPSGEVGGGEYSLKNADDERVHFNPEHHLLLEDAKKIKKGVELNDEIIFPLEAKDDYGRIAAQTAKQVIIQKIREAERTSIIDEYGGKEGEIISGIVQKVERGNVYVDFNRATGILPAEEQIPGEFWERGRRVRAYLYSVEDTPRGINLRLSRTHPKFIEKLFAQEAPEIENGVVEIKSVAREAGARSKISVHSNDEHIDAVGSCVGQKGTRVNTITTELSGEKIDIIPWSADPKQFVSNALSPAKVISIEVDEKERKATVEVANDQLSLAIGKGGQNVRLAAKLTGWRIDIKGDEKAPTPEEVGIPTSDEDQSVRKEEK
ncbi:MAG: Transcription termination factor NusA [Candidatus Nomurabacteria bacterium GW2011_GWA2_43_15]|nr:MAG: Transcription termination factor NusA [Candidatus Nomurabacteria bacterium GW2011_GWA2_43_15]KKT18807.1 MAG: Transcription termination factor NusA [Candidatus Nomurabacteria bacterium GW2011_GWB1_43_7]